MNINKKFNEKMCLSRYPKKGKCKETVFANGYHRAGMLPFRSLLDGGAPGDIYREFCMECGKMFKKERYVIKDQPRSLYENSSS